MGFVTADFPALLPCYERAFAGTNARSDYLAAMERRVARVRELHGFADEAMADRRRAEHRPAAAGARVKSRQQRPPLPFEART